MGKLVRICFYYVIVPLHQQEFVREGGAFLQKDSPRCGCVRSLPAGVGLGSSVQKFLL